MNLRDTGDINPEIIVLNNFTSFLDQAGLRNYTVTFLAGDASPRKYYRIATSNNTYVLMDSPLLESNDHFTAISETLNTAGFSAPKVLLRTSELLLLEDLGDCTFTFMLKHYPEQRDDLYRLATQTTLGLSTKLTDQPQSVPLYTLEKFLEGVTTFLDWYYPETQGHQASQSARQSFLELWTHLYRDFQALPQGIMLRDFHVDNLIYLENRPDIKACGLLDFQDACWGPAVYDFLSLIDDVRLDLSDILIDQCWAHYLRAFPTLNKSLAQKLSVSRLTRILGVFVRLAKRDGKSHYLNHIPRIWKIMERNFRNPDLVDIKTWFDVHIFPTKRQELIAPQQDFNILNSDSYRCSQKEQVCTQAMILAAGMGKRLQPLTLTTPKPLIELKGKPLIQYALDRLKSMSKVVVNTHYLADQIHTYLANKNVIISHENSLLETGGGVLNALHHFRQDPILCLNSDIWWQENQGNILEELMSTWDDAFMDVLLVLVQKENTLNFAGLGDFTWDDKTLTPAFRENDTAPYVYTGIQILHPRAFLDEKPRSFSLVEIYKKAAKQNRLKAIVLNGKWSDVGTPQALEKLGEMDFSISSFKEMR
jgi:aminoglycoside/choline kinase family phosphotransferase/choline kinase